MGNIRNLNQLLSALKRGYSIQKGADKTAPYFYAVREQKKEGRQFCISLAGRNVGICSQYAEVYNLCREYLSEEESEIQITTYDTDIAYEREEAALEKTAYSDSYLETLAVYRKISEAMLDYDTFLMHGAVVAKGQNAYMFTAKSGTGKSTHVNLWLDRLEDTYIVNGDKPLIRLTDKEAIACGTPWCGKEQLGRNCMVPLKAIVFMERGEKNIINEISYSEAFTFLIQQTYQPKDAENMKKTLKLLSQLKGKVRFYRYIFDNMKEDAFDVSFKTLTEGNI